MGRVRRPKSSKARAMPAGSSSRVRPGTPHLVFGDDGGRHYRPWVITDIDRKADRAGK